MRNWYIGIDNGVSGAIAALRPSDGRIEWITMPVYETGETLIDDIAVQDFVRAKHNDGNGGVFVVFEIGQKQPKFGCKTNFAQGYSYGAIQSAIRTMRDIPFQPVNPKTWQTPMLKDVRKQHEDTKAASIAVCKRLFPHANLHKTPRCTTDFDGAADAINIAEWARRGNL